MRHIQRLKGFLLLCDKCHAIKHFGRTYTRFGKDEALMEALDEHYCRVNGCKSGDLKRHYRVAFSEWDERSKHEWTQDLGEWASAKR